MFTEARGTRIWHEASGREEGPPVVLLHGWGARAETMASIAACLSATYRVYALDFPGFGQSPPPPVPWSVGDYAAAVHELLAQWGVRQASMIGHSHGGRVAIMLAATYPDAVDRLILVDSAGIRPPRSARHYLMAAMSTAGRVLFALPGLSSRRDRMRFAVAGALGAADYAAAGPLRETFNRVVNEDLTPLLGRIRASTLLIWGDNDRDTPVSDGRLMEREIPDAGLVVFPGAGHYAFLDRPAEFCAIVRHFLSDPASASGATPTTDAAAHPSAPAAPRTQPPSTAGKARSSRRALRRAAIGAAALLCLAIALVALVLLGRAAAARPDAANLLGTALALAAAVPWATLLVRREVRFLAVLQGEEYNSRRCWSWAMAAFARRTHTRGATLWRAALLALVAFQLVYHGPLQLLFLIYGAFALYGLAALAGSTSSSSLLRRAFAGTLRRQEEGPALVYTRKAQLLLALSTAAGGLVVLAVVWLCQTLAASVSGTPLVSTLPLAIVVGVYLACQGALLCVLAANMVLSPVQATAKWWVVRRATKRLRAQQDLLVVGISGAYGKTTVKEILATILESRYRVLKTPHSYNTPLGIARVILRDLRADHQVFVCEMGSYAPGDVAYLCRIAPPRVGIMTAVGPAHLERFGSVEAIARTDYELIQALPAESGVAVFNGDDDWCHRLAAETTVRRVVQTGLHRAPSVELWASDIATTTTGVQFTVHHCSGNAAAFRVGLLGRHNVGNVLMATAAALACGMTLQEVARAAERVQAAAHRLQLVRGAGGVTIIDDSYNANPEGVAAALAVLGEMEGRRKVLVTAGIFELGTREVEEHRKLGQLAARVCDTAILIGSRHTRPILEELQGSGFPADHTFVVRTVAEAQAQLARLLAPGDVVLFGADPPGHYVD